MHLWRCMFHGWICLAIWVVAVPVFAQSPKPVTITADVVYGSDAGTEFTLDMLVPAEAANGAGIIRLVSGGYRSTAAPPDRTAAALSEYLERGYTVFNVRHGSSPQFNVAQIAVQVRRGVRFVRHHARDHGVDPNRLGIMGSSSGGHLSLLVALSDPAGDSRAADKISKESCRIAAVVAFAAPVDLRDIDERLKRRMEQGPEERERAERLRPAFDFDPTLRPALSPLLQVSSDDPPTLLIHGDQDHVVDPGGSRKLFEELQKHGVESKLLMLEGNSHRDWSDDNRQKQLEATLEWFDLHLRAR